MSLKVCMYLCVCPGEPYAIFLAFIFIACLMNELSKHMPPKACV